MVRAIVPFGGVGEIVGQVRLERVQVTCPACGQKIEAVARDGRVRGYCTIAGQYLDFPAPTARVVGTQHRARMSQAIKKRWQDPEYRAKKRQARQKG